MVSMSEPSHPAARALVCIPAILAGSLELENRLELADNSNTGRAVTSGAGALVALRRKLPMQFCPMVTHRLGKALSVPKA